MLVCAFLSLYSLENVCLRVPRCLVLLHLSYLRPPCLCPTLILLSYPTFQGRLMLRRLGNMFFFKLLLFHPMWGSTPLCMCVCVCYEVVVVVFELFFKMFLQRYNRNILHNIMLASFYLPTDSLGILFCFVIIVVVGLSYYFQALVLRKQSSVAFGVSLKCSKIIVILCVCGLTSVHFYLFRHATAHK